MPTATYFDLVSTWNDEFIRIVINHRIGSKQRSHATFDCVLPSPFACHAFQLDNVVFRGIHHIRGLKFALQGLVLDTMVKILFIRDNDHAWVFAYTAAALGLSATKELRTTGSLEMRCVSALVVGGCLTCMVRPPFSSLLTSSI